MNQPESTKMSVVPFEQHAVVAESELMNVLRSSLYPGAKNESIKLVLSYCRAAGLDPMLKPVHIVPMWDRNAGEMRDVIMPGIGMYRTQASRSGECAGVTEPEYGPDVTDNIGGENITYPAWCKVTVKRRNNGNIAEFTAKEFWKENYAVRGGKEKSIAPNAMWAKRPYGQIAKCAEAQALRKAFPELGSQPIAEEMEGKTIQVDPEVITPVVPQLPDGRYDEIGALFDGCADMQAVAGVWQALTPEERKATAVLKDDAKVRVLEVS